MDVSRNTTVPVKLGVSKMSTAVDQIPEQWFMQTYWQNVTMTTFSIKTRKDYAATYATITTY